MIKVENNMLVLDSAFTKEDVLAINHFVQIAEDRIVHRVLDILEDNRAEDTVLIDAIKAEFSRNTEDSK
jgi:hypothetical protein